MISGANEALRLGPTFILVQKREGCNPDTPKRRPPPLALVEGAAHPAKLLIPILVVGCLGFGFWVGVEAGSPLPVDTSLLDGVAEGRVALGTMTLTTRHTTYLGTLVYARLAAANADAQLDYYANRTGSETDGAPPPVCLQNCDGVSASNVTGRDKLFEDLHRALGDIQRDLDMELKGLSQARLGTPEGEVVYIVFGTLPERAVDVTALRAVVLEDVRTRLLRACGDAVDAGEFTLPPGVGCNQLYVRFSVDADWDLSPSRYLDLERPNNTNVLGPLVWTTTANAADSIERDGVLGLANDLAQGEHTGPLYMPWSSFALVVIGLMPGLVWNRVAARLKYPKVLPMVLLSATVGGVTLVLIRYGYHMGPSYVFVPIAYACLYIPAYRYYQRKPAGWIDYYSWLLVPAGLFISVGYTLWQFDQIPLDTNLVPRLYTGLLEIEAASILRIAMKIYLATLLLAFVVLGVLWVFAHWELHHAKKQVAQTAGKPLEEFTLRELYDICNHVGPAAELLLRREVRVRRDRIAMTRESETLPPNVENPSNLAQRAYAPFAKKVRQFKVDRVVLMRGDEPTLEEILAGQEDAQRRLEGWKAA